MTPRERYRLTNRLERLRRAVSGKHSLVSAINRQWAWAHAQGELGGTEPYPEATDCLTTYTRTSPPTLSIVDWLAAGLPPPSYTWLSDDPFAVKVPDAVLPLVTYCPGCGFGTDRWPTYISSIDGSRRCSCGWFREPSINPIVLVWDPEFESLIEFQTRAKTYSLTKPKALP